MLAAVYRKDASRCVFSRSHGVHNHNSAVLVAKHDSPNQENLKILSAPITQNFFLALAFLQTLLTWHLRGKCPPKHLS